MGAGAAGGAAATGGVALHLGEVRLRARAPPCSPAWTRTVAPRPPLSNFGSVPQPRAVIERLDRWGPRLVVAASMLLTLAWIVRDRVAPAWDQSHYLWLTDSYVTALADGGIRAFDDVVYDLDPGRAPLHTLLLVPLTLLTGPGVRGALLLNVVVWPVLLFGVHRATLRLFDRRAALLALVITATMPIIVGLSHEVLADFLLCGLSALAVALLLDTDHFGGTRASALLGVVVGLGCLAKVTFVAFIIGPVAFVAIGTIRRVVHERRAGERTRARERMRNVALATAGAAVVAGLWYVPSFSETREYISATTSGELTLGMAPDEPLRPGELARFAMITVTTHLSWIVALVGSACAIGVVIAWLRGRRRHPDAGPDLVRAGLLLSWIAIPYLSVSTSANQDQRLMAPIFPAIAVLVAGLVTSIRSDRARRAAVAALVIGGVLQLSLLTVRWDIPFAPDKITIDTPAGDAYLHLASDPVGYNRLPGGRDDASPALAHLEAATRAADGSIAPRRVGVLQPHAAINPNTLRYLAGTRDVPFTFIDVRAESDPAVMRAVLAELDAILYIPPPPRPADPEADRIYQLTVLSASYVVTPEMLEQFGEHRAWFELADGRRVLVAVRTGLQR